MPPGLLRRIPLQILYEKRSRSDQTHITFEYVKKLRQFIQRSRPKKPAQGSQSLTVRKQTAITVADVGHGPELVHAKRPAVQAGSLLFEENRGAHALAHQMTNDKQDGTKKDQSGCCKNTIKESFHLNCG
jgi:hypothetical protein